MQDKSFERPTCDFLEAANESKFKTSSQKIWMMLDRRINSNVLIAPNGTSVLYCSPSPDTQFQPCYFCYFGLMPD